MDASVRVFYLIVLKIFLTVHLNREDGGGGVCHIYSWQMINHKFAVLNSTRSEHDKNSILLSLWGCGSKSYRNCFYYRLEGILQVEYCIDANTNTWIGFYPNLKTL